MLQNDRQVNLLVNIEVNLAAEEPDITLRSWWTPEAELKGE